MCSTAIQTARLITVESTEYGAQVAGLQLSVGPALVTRDAREENKPCCYEGARALYECSVQCKQWHSWLLGGCRGCGPSGLVDLAPTARGIVDGEATEEG